MGMTAPRPVTTARRAGSGEGGTFALCAQLGLAIVARRTEPESRDQSVAWLNVPTERARTSVPVVALEYDRAVVATEPDIVREAIADFAAMGLGRNAQIDVRVGIAIVEGHWHGLLRD